MPSPHSVLFGGNTDYGVEKKVSLKGMSSDDINRKLETLQSLSSSLNK
jgi:hypothetical protein